MVSKKAFEWKKTPHLSLFLWLLGVLCEGHRYLDGCVLAVCVLRTSRVRCRQLCVPAAQRAAQVQKEEEAS